MPIEEAFGGEIVRGLEAVTRFGGLDVEGEYFSATATFKGAIAGFFVAYMVFKGSEEERSEATFFALGLTYILPSQEFAEKALGEIFGFVMGMAAAAQETVQGKPVTPAKCVESGLAFVCRASRSENQGPTGGEKLAGVGICGIVDGIHGRIVTSLAINQRDIALVGAHNCRSAS